MRGSDLELQGPENDCARERDRRTNLRWIFLPPCQRAEACVEEGFRAQETEETALRCVFTMCLERLWVARHQCSIQVCRVKHLLLVLPPQQLYAVHGLFARKNKYLYVMPKLWKDILVDGCIWSDRGHPLVCIYDTHT